MSQRWIGLTGRAGAGKDYTYSALAFLDKRLRRVSFADQLREEIEYTFGAHLPSLWTKPYKPALREALQWWGTEYRRASDPNYWVMRAEQVALSLDGTPVFTDVRFPNEADMIRSHGGLIVAVAAPNAIRGDRTGEIVSAAHASEDSMDDYEVDMHIISVADPQYRIMLKNIIAESRLTDLINDVRESFK